jgi:hypothetical protein
MKGRDILIGALLGALVVIWATNHHDGKSSASQVKHSVSVQSSSPPHGGRTPAAHPSRHAATTHPAARSSHPAAHTPATHPASTAHTGSAARVSHTGATPTRSPHPSMSAHATRRAATGASHPAKSLDVSAGLIAIASLIAIAASLSTVTMTMRSLRAAK